MDHMDWHARDVIERNTLDGGFSKGWGSHFLPVPDRIFDTHVHLESIEPDIGCGEIGHYLRSTSKIAPASAAIVLPMDIRAIKHGNRPRTDRNRLLELAERVSGMKEVETLLYLDYREPDARFLEKAVASGVSGLKIWNGTFILNGAEKDCYDGRAWREVFDFIEQRGLPVLWHVTQRLSDAPYVGGGRNSYWKQGWKRGAVYTNQDLLDSFLRIVGSHPGIPFLGAHQLHVGWEKLDELFCEYANLHVDTSIGCFLRPDDEIHPEDAERIRKVIGKWPDRFLFGTDTGLGPIDEEDPPLTDLKGHLRFLRHLGLSDSILQLVTHGNGERIFRRITGQEKESQG